jgi:hypothetical protein
MNRMTQSIALTLAGLASFAVLGCESQTEGERTLERAETIEDAGNMIRRGEKLVADGKAQVARGQTVRDQGDRVEGDRLVAEGRAMQRQGEALIAEGRRLKD